VILPATKDGANPRNKLARTEWLSEVVVGPDLQTYDPAYVFLQRSEQNDRDIRSLGP
jgi:hypothetical protein